jgi:hypothetical protein
MPDTQSNSKIDFVAIFLVGLFLILLCYASYLSYISIDYNILKKLEAQPLNLPPPATSSATLNPNSVVSPTPSPVK